MAAAKRAAAMSQPAKKSDKGDPAVAAESSAAESSSGDASAILERFFNRRHRSVLIVLTILFVALETYYCVFRSFAIDEFNVAVLVNRLKTKVPYVDFAPYKTVLGYYYHLPFLASSDDPWVGLVRVRLGVAWLTALSILLAALTLCRRYRPAAVCLAFAMLVVMTSFTEKAFELRVDMLTGLVGFGSLLLLLDRRIALAGVAAGVSYLVSQKGALFGIAGGFSLGVWLLLRRDREALRQWATFCGFVALPIALYVVVWSFVSSPDKVFQITFFHKTHIKALTTPAFENIWGRSWLQTLSRNPLYYPLAVVAILRLLTTMARRPRFRDLALLAYGSAMCGLFLLLPQPWPYYFVLLIPTLFVLHVDILSKALSPERGQARIVWVCCVALGLLVPLARVPQVIAKDNYYQRRMFHLANSIVGTEERYLAGAPLLYQREQHASEYRFVNHNSATPMKGYRGDAAEMIDRLSEDRIVLFIFNYKIGQLPRPIQQYLTATYTHLCGAIWTYAPQVAAGNSALDLPFAGTYLIDAGAGGASEIDGGLAATGSLVDLDHGHHEVDGESPTRLTLIPPEISNAAPSICRQSRGFFDPHVDH